MESQGQRVGVLGTRAGQRSSESFGGRNSFPERASPKEFGDGQRVPPSLAGMRTAYVCFPLCSTPYARIKLLSFAHLTAADSANEAAPRGVTFPIFGRKQKHLYCVWPSQTRYLASSENICFRRSCSVHERKCACGGSPSSTR